MLRARASSLLALALPTLAACAAARPAGETTPSAAPTASAEALGAPLRAVLMPTVWEFESVADDGQGGSYTIGGSVRAHVRADNSVELSNDGALHPFVTQTRDGAHWFFVTRDGLMLRSEGYLGALERAGETEGRRIDAGFVSAGTVAARSADGRLWFGGTAPRAFRTAPAPVSDSPLVDAGFIDPLVGLAVTVPGDVLRTSDGGEHFAPVALNGEAAYVIHPQPDGFVLVTTGGLVRVSGDGLAQPYQARAQEPLEARPRPLSDDAQCAIHTAVERRHALSLPLRLLRGGWLTGERRSAVVTGPPCTPVTEQNRALVTYGADGSELSRVDLPAGECDVHPFGARWLARCRGQSGTARTIYETDGRRPWAEIHQQNAGGMGPMVVGLDGSAAVFPGACGADTGNDEAPSEDSTGTTQLCWYDGTSFHSRAVAGRIEVLSIYGGQAIVGPAHRDELLQRMLGDIRRGAVRALSGEMNQGGLRVLRAGEIDAHELSLAMGSSSLMTARFTATGDLWGVAINPRGRTALALGRGDTDLPLRVRELPEGARDVAMLDARRGIAAGETLRELWTTRDGGEHWESAALPLTGDRGGTPLRRSETFNEEASDAGGVLSCGRGYCVAGRSVVFFGGDGAAGREEGAFAVHAATRFPHDDEDARTADPRRHGHEQGYYYVSLPEALEQPAQRWHGAQGWAEMSPAFPTSPTQRVTLRWSGVDEQGPFTASSAPSVLAPVQQGPLPTSDLARRLAEALSRQGNGVSRSLAPTVGSVPRTRRPGRSPALTPTQARQRSAATIAGLQRSIAGLQPVASREPNPEARRRWQNLIARLTALLQAEQGDQPGALGLPPPSVSGPTELLPLTPVPRLVSRTLLLLERCELSPDFPLPNCDLLAVPRGGAPVPVGGLRALLRSDHADDPRITVQATVSLPDGGAAVLVRLGTLSDLDFRALGVERADVVLRLDARGRVTARRGFAWSSAPAARMLAVGTDGAPGLAVATADTPRELRFYPLAASEPARPWLTIPDRVQPCADSAPPNRAGSAPNPALLVVSSGGYAPRLDLGIYHLRPDQWSRTLFERAPEGQGNGVCMRSVYFWNISSDDPVEHDLVAAANGTPVVLARRGRLEAYAVGSGPRPRTLQVSEQRE